MIQLFFTFFSASLGLMILGNNSKRRSSNFFSGICILSSFWCFTNFMTDKSPEFFWFETSYAMGILILCCGFFWAHELVGVGVRLGTKIFVCSLTMLFSLLAFTPGFIDPEYFIPEPNRYNFNIFLFIYFVFYFLISFKILRILFKSFKYAKDSQIRSQLFIILWGLVITLLTTTISSFVFPFFSIFTSGTLDSVGYSIFLAFVTYTIIRHKLFSLKVISMHLVVFILWLGIFIRVILSLPNENLLLELIIFIIALIVGVIVIRNTLQNIEQRHQIELLTKKLEKAYTEPYHDIP